MLKSLLTILCFLPCLLSVGCNAGGQVFMTTIEQCACGRVHGAAADEMAEATLRANDIPNDVNGDEPLGVVKLHGRGSQVALINIGVRDGQLELPDVPSPVPDVPLPEPAAEPPLEDSIEPEPLEVQPVTVEMDADPPDPFRDTIPYAMGPVGADESR